MAQFNYKAKTNTGEIKNGIIQAENKTVVIKRLRQDGLYPVSIEEAVGQSVKKITGKISSRDIAVFTRQLANLIRSGFSLSDTLSTLSQQEQNHSLKKIILDFHEKVQKGSTFSEALNAYPNIFSSFFINIVTIGEASGKLDESLLRLADFKEREEELSSQVKSALIYPVFLFSLGIITVLILITFFIPRFAVMFSDMGQALPLPTRIIIGLSHFMSKFWWVVFALIFSVIVLIKAYYRAERNRLATDRLILGLPLAGNVILRMEIARFSYALGVLLKSGVTVLEALGVVILSVSNRFFRKKIFSFQDDIRRGESLSDCLKTDKIFPPVLVNSVRVGEESGELADMLLKTAATFETELNRDIKTLVSFIEPILILFIGGIVVLIVMSMLLPIFQMDLLVR